MRAFSRLVAALFLPAAVAAQDPAPGNPEPEIGFRGGLSRVTEPGSFGGTTETSTIIALPGTSFFFANGIYMTFFPSPTLGIQPQLGFMRQSSDGFSSSLAFLAVQPEWFFTAGAQSSGYLFGQLGVLRNSSSGGGSDDSENHAVYGVGLGYRNVIRRALAMRYEVRLRRLNNDPGDPLTEVGVMIGVAAVIPRKAP